MRQPLFLQSATHDIVRGCVKTSQTAFGGQLPYQGSQTTNSVLQTIIYSFLLSFFSGPWVYLRRGRPA